MPRVYEEIPKWLPIANYAAIGFGLLVRAWALPMAAVGWMAGVAWNLLKAGFEAGTGGPLCGWTGDKLAALEAGRWLDELEDDEDDCPNCGEDDLVNGECRECGWVVTGEGDEP
jgi:hypothetical protein